MRLEILAKIPFALVDSDAAADNSVIDVIPVLPPRQDSYPPRSSVLRRRGQEHRISTKGLPSFFPSQHESNSCQTSGSSTAIRIQEGINNAEETEESSSRAAREFSGIAMTESNARRKVTDDDPVSHQDALSRIDSERWRVALKEEYQALMENNTWSLSALPEGSN